MNVHVDHRRSIIDRRALADRLTELRRGKSLIREATSILRAALDQGRAERSLRKLRSEGCP